MANSLGGWIKMSRSNFDEITPSPDIIYRVRNSNDSEDIYIGAQKLNNLADIAGSLQITDTISENNNYAISSGAVYTVLTALEQRVEALEALPLLQVDP